ncbi:hypothetical protein [Amycolatopsis silviterrae]|uniref:HEAT repeat domain-containing protein n=1 Tax=Amycolatopsis silviterrae TaxID=1656914 RepID=A0ABW5H6L1_9PSEU
MFGRSRRRQIDRLFLRENTAKLANLLHRGSPEDRQMAAERLLIVVATQDRSPSRAIVEPRLRALVNPLLRTLGGSNSGPDLRDLIAATLGHIGDPAALPALAALLPDTNSSNSTYSHRRTVGAVAADALGRIGGPAARRALVDALADERFPGPRHPLLSALAAETECGPNLARALIAMFLSTGSPEKPDPSDDAAGAAADVLDRVGVPLLRHVLVDALADVQSQSRLLPALLSVDARGLVDMLIQLIRTGDTAARRAATNTLANLNQLAGKRHCDQAIAALHEAVDPGGVLRRFLDNERTVVRKRHHDSLFDTLGKSRRPPWDHGKHPDITAAIIQNNWAQVVKFGATAADLLIRVIATNNDDIFAASLAHSPARNDRFFRLKSTENAVVALKEVVSAHADLVPRWILQAGALVGDFAVPLTPSVEEAYAYNVDVSNLRSVCLEAYFTPA